MAALDRILPLRSDCMQQLTNRNRCVVLVDAILIRQPQLY